MKIILFRSNNIFDSRVNKYRNYYERSKIDYTIVGWDRKKAGWSKENYDFYRYQAGEAEGGMRAVRNHCRWMFFVFRYLYKHQEVSTVHACDLNSAFPAAVFKTLFKRKLNLIFDSCDWFSSTFARYRIICRIFGAMEWFTCKKADAIIICEPERREQIKFRLSREPIVMPNIPEIDSSSIKDGQAKYSFDNSNPTIAYMGGFAHGRFLKELLALSKSEPFNLLIAGSGQKEIEEACLALNDNDNVKYYGRLDMIEGLKMENAADVIYAMYCKINPNHIYAAPNKYYEAMLLGKPLITTKGTIVGDKVDKYNTGWVIEENVDELRKVLNTMSINSIKTKGSNAFSLWNNQFKDYITTFFDNKYKFIMK